MNVAGFDKVIIGAGFYGLYAAYKCSKQGQQILVIEREREALLRASYVNQARVHMGYHYPRSFSTAIKSASYFERFCNDFGFCIYKAFNQIYATSSHFSWTNAEDFRLFCKNVNIRCDCISPDWYFNPGMCDGAFITKEYTYDAQILKKWFIDELSRMPNVKISYNHYPEKITRCGHTWRIEAQDLVIATPFILNSAYASINDVLKITEGGGTF